MVSDWLTRHIKLMENFHPTAYPDPGYGWAIPTIGYGRTEGVYQGEVTSRAHEERWLQDKLGYIADSITELVTVDLSVSQLDALTALAYNVGLGGPNTEKGLYRSKMRAKLNAGDYEGAAGEFDDWIYSNGKRLEGLVTRRALERKHFERK
jgi:lysozyme